MGVSWDCSGGLMWDDAGVLGGLYIGATVGIIPLHPKP